MRLSDVGMEGVEEYLSGLVIAYTHAASTRTFELPSLTPPYHLV